MITSKWRRSIVIFRNHLRTAPNHPTRVLYGACLQNFNTKVMSVCMWHTIPLHIVKHGWDTSPLWTKCEHRNGSSYMHMHLINHTIYTWIEDPMNIQFFIVIPHHHSSLFGNASITYEEEPWCWNEKGFHHMQTTLNLAKSSVNSNTIFPSTNVSNFCSMVWEREGIIA